MKKFLVVFTILFALLLTSLAPTYALVPDGHENATGRVRAVGVTPGIGYPGEPLEVVVRVDGRVDTVPVRFHFRPFFGKEGEEWTYAIDIDVHSGRGEMTLVLPCSEEGLLDITSGHITLTIFVSHPVPGLCSGWGW